MILQKVDRIMRQKCRSWESKMAIATDRSQYYWSLLLYLIMNRNVFNLTSGVCPPRVNSNKVLISLYQTDFLIDRVYFVKLLISTMFYHFITSDIHRTVSNTDFDEIKKSCKLKATVLFVCKKKYENPRFLYLRGKGRGCRSQLDLGGILKREHALTLYWFDTYWGKHT